MHEAHYALYALYALNFYLMINNYIYEIINKRTKCIKAFIEITSEKIVWVQITIPAIIGTEKITNAIIA